MHVIYVFTYQSLVFFCKFYLSIRSSNLIANTIKSRALKKGMKNQVDLAMP